MTDTTEASTERELASEAAAALRELADLVEAYPEFAEDLDGETIRFYVPQWREGAAEQFARMAKALGGERVKSADDRWFHIERQFGPITVQLFTDRQVVCTKRVVGTRTVEKPDPNAPKITVEEDVVEWECSPLLAGAVDQ